MTFSQNNFVLDILCCGVQKVCINHPLKYYHLNFRYREFEFANLHIEIFVMELMLKCLQCHKCPSALQVPKYLNCLKEWMPWVSKYLECPNVLSVWMPRIPTKFQVLSQCQNRTLFWIFFFEINNGIRVVSDWRGYGSIHFYSRTLKVLNFACVNFC